jgi:hypothetical protein
MSLTSAAWKDIQASAECDSTMQPERKEILQVGHYYIKK